MATTNIIPLEVLRGGQAVSYAAANVDGSYCPNDGRVVFLVKNGDTSSKTVTVTPNRKIGGNVVAADVTTIPASGQRYIGPFKPEIYNDSAGRIFLAFSAITSVTLVPIHLGAGAV